MSLRNRPYLMGFLIGLLIFSIPIYMLIVPRGPCVETTDFHMEPNVVRPDQKFHAVWTDKALRECDGTVNRRYIATSDIDIWVFPPVHTVRHGQVGSTNRFHTPWIAPEAPPGTTLLLRKNISRWANFVQKWLWTMDEVQEAPFSIVESAQEPRQP